MIELNEGVILCTKNGQHYSNAYVLSSSNNKTKIITDFGNIVTMNNDVLMECFEVSETYRDAKFIDYPLPGTVERLQEQLVLIQSAIKKLTN